MMTKRGVGNTAVGAAVCRLFEQFQPPESRLFRDPLVKDMVGVSIRALAPFAWIRHLTIKRMDAITPGIYGAQVCRTCFIDEVVQAALAQGIEQLVILGAGLDTRPYRLAGLEHVRVFEVDLPAVQEDKKKRLHKHFGRLPQHVTFVPIDFDRQSLEDVFAATSFDASRPTIFIWEGVTQYITEEAVRRTLAFVGAAAPGSVLVFTYVLQSVIERRSDIVGADRMMDMVGRGNAPWLFGLEPSHLAAFLQPFHLHVQMDVGNEEYQERYIKPRGRTLVVSEVERTVHAVVPRPIPVIPL